MEIFPPSVKTPHSRIPSFYQSRFSISSIRETLLFSKPNVVSWNNLRNIDVRKLALCNSFSDGVSIAEKGLDCLPLSMELELISGETQFDRIINEAQRLQESVVILWMASWCRKCIYLKPKLEKLAADYYPRIRFYSVDVNTVPHKLVVRAGITKMPTIQIWRDGEKEAEVFGGHKPYLVVNEIRQLLENENSNI